MAARRPRDRLTPLAHVLVPSAADPASPHRPLRVVVADDEPLARENLRLALGAHPDVVVVAECADGRATVAAVQVHRPDLVFLDVQMPGGDGFDVIARVGSAAMPAVVFVTAYDAYALRAFEVHALDYLLKPFDDQRLAETLTRARRRLAADPPAILVERLAALLADARAAGRGAVSRDAEPTDAPPAGLTRFVVRDGDRAVLVRVQDVDWFEAHGNYVRLHVRAAVHRVRVTLGTLAAQVDPRQFARIHKSTVVNLDRVREVQPWFGGDYVAILHDGRQLRVSRTYAQALLRPLQ